MTPSQDAREALTEWLEYQIEHGCAPDGYAIEMTEEYAMGRRSAFVAAKTTIETMPEAHLRTPATDTEAMRLLRQLSAALGISIAEADPEIVRGQLEQNKAALDSFLAKGGAS